MINIGVALICMILVNEYGSRIECKSGTRGVLTDVQPSACCWSGADSPLHSEVSPGPWNPGEAGGNQISKTVEDSHLWEGAAAAGYEFGWGASPGAGAKEEPGKHNGTTISPALMAIVAFLGSALLIASYYKIVMKYCRLWEWSNITGSLRRIDSREQLDDSDAVLQDSEGWQIFTRSYGLDEGVIKSIPVRTYNRGDQFVEGTECAVCLVDFQENESLRILPKCSHAFHTNCVDAWLRSHANCPLCRANIMNPDSPFVPAMASRIRPNLENGMALVVHDSFRAEEVGSNDRNVEQTNNFEAEPIILSSELQSRSADDERAINVDALVAKRSPDEGPGAPLAEISGGNGMLENGLLLISPRALTRSYSLGSCSGNEHFRREDTRDGERIDLESPMDSLLGTDIASPWRHRRTALRWSKTLSPFNSKASLFPFGSRGLRSPFSRKGSSSSAINWSSIFPHSPGRRAMADSRRAGATRLRGGSFSPPFFRVGRSESVGSQRILAMTSPLFVKRSFSVFTPNRLRTGDPEALLSPPRFSQRHH